MVELGKYTTFEVSKFGHYTIKTEIELTRQSLIWHNSHRLAIGNVRNKNREFAINLERKLILKGWDLPLIAGMDRNGCINLEFTHGTPTRLFIEANAVNLTSSIKGIILSKGRPVYPEFFEPHLFTKS